MVKRFFLDGINAEAGRAAVGGEYYLIVLTHAHKTGTTLSFMQLAVTRAEIALDAAIV